MATSNTALVLGDRVQVPVDKTDSRRGPLKGESTEGSVGTLRYIGPVDERAGDWCGIELDEPVGKNDGSVKGKSYFSCSMSHGIFVRREIVERVRRSSRLKPSKRPGAGIARQLTVEVYDFEVGVTSDEVFEHRRSSVQIELDKVKQKGGIWAQTVNDLAYRGVKLSHILGFYQRLTEGELTDSAGNVLLPHFDPKQHTTNDVVRQAIIPASRASIFGDCAYATLACSNKPQLATVMVSHHWKNLFCHLIAAMVAFALGRASYESVVEDLHSHDFEKLRKLLDKRDSLQMTFWGCLFCVNQHISICNSFPPQPDLPKAEAEALKWWRRETHDPVNSARFQACPCTSTKHYNDSEKCEMDKFDAMMAVLADEAPKVAQRFHHLIVVDKQFEVFGRIWVMAEIAKGQELEVTQHAMLYGGATSLSAREVENLRENLDIRKCNASRREDVDRILASIPDVERFNNILLDTLFNKQTGILQAWSADQVAGFFDMIDPLKDLFSGKMWQAPMVICMGQESTGKSTLMERLTGCPIFPRDSDLCTRAILKVKLRRGPAADPKLFVEDFYGNGERLVSIKRENLSSAVLKEMARQVRLEAKGKSARAKDDIEVDDGPLSSADGVCTNKMICIEFSSPTSPNLDLVDTPGLVAARGRGRPEDVVHTTRELVRNFVEAHKQKALFIVTVKAAEQPNNSLAMQLVQDLQIESNTLGVLTMTDMLTGNLTDGETRLQKGFLKNSGPRLIAVLKNLDDVGGTVPLGLGYILTALNDVSESKGWSSYSRVDAMANWEQLFFQELERQWQDLDRAADLSLVRSRSTCNGVWRHIKSAVEEFIRTNWLYDAYDLVLAEEANAHRKEAELGYPRALSVDHAEMLRLVTVGLPGSLAAATKLTDLTSNNEVKRILSKYASEAFESFVSELGPLNQVLDSLEQIVTGVVTSLPEKIYLGDRIAFCIAQVYVDPVQVLDEILEKIEQGLRNAMCLLQDAVTRHIRSKLMDTTTPERLGRFSAAIEHLMMAAEYIFHDIAEGDGTVLGSVKSLRTTLGVSPGCGLLSTCWVRIETGQGSRRPQHGFLDRLQIQERCLLVLNQYATATLRKLPLTFRETCEFLAPEMCAEDPKVSWKRYEILAQLQQVRLAKARLKSEDAFAEDVQKLEQTKGFIAKVLHLRTDGPAIKTRRNAHKHLTKTALDNSDELMVSELALRQNNASDAPVVGIQGDVDSPKSRRPKIRPLVHAIDAVVTNEQSATSRLEHAQHRHDRKQGVMF